MRNITASIVLVLVFFTAMSSAYSGINDRKEISNTYKIIDATYTINESITVVSGGVLEIINSTVFMKSDSLCELYINISSGGKLKIINSFLQGGNITSIICEKFSFIEIINSTLSSMNGSRGGLIIMTNYANISFLRLDNSSCAFKVESSEIANVRSITINDCEVGMLINNSNAKITKLNISNCKYGIKSINSSVEIIDSKINTTRFSASLYISKFKFLNTTLDIEKIETSKSSYSIEWYISFNVVWHNYTPIEGAVINLKSNASQNYTGITDKNGTCKIILPEILCNDESITYCNPYDLKVEKDHLSVSMNVFVSGSIDMPVVIDGVPPKIAFEYPKENAIIPKRFFLVSGESGDNSGVEKVVVRVDGGFWIRANGTLKWEAMVYTESDGIHIIEARAYDWCGGWASAFLYVEVDTTPPIIKIAHPDNGTIVNDTKTNITVICEVEQVHLGDIIFNVTPNKPTNLEINLTNEGKNEIKIWAEDSVKNRNETSIVIIRDTIPPSIHVIEPGPYCETDKGIVTVKISLNDTHRILSASYSINGGSWVYLNISEIIEFQVKLTKGINTILIMATDIVENTNISHISIIYKQKDMTPPRIQINSPSNGTVVKNMQIIVCGTAIDDSLVATVEYSTDGKNWKKCYGGGNWLCDVKLTEGENIIYIRAIDTWGNSAVETVVVIYSPPPPDSNPPELAIKFPHDGDVVHSKKVEFNGFVYDRDSGVKYVYVFINGRKYVCAVNGTEWTVEVEIPDGEYTAEIVAIDEYNNTKSISISFKVESKSPPVEISIAPIAALIVIIIIFLSIIVIAFVYKGIWGDSDEE